jgi:hypothetical protein
VESGG